MRLLKYSEWEINGRWYCNDTDGASDFAGLWWTPARMLNLSPDAFIEMLIRDFKPDHISYSREHCVLLYSWDSQAQMRKFKNWINKQARDKNFYV